MAYGWWDALVHNGCLIAPARLQQHISDDLEPLPYWQSERLRRAYGRFLARRELGPWIEAVLLDALGHNLPNWATPTGDDWTVKLVTGENHKPRRIFYPDGNPFPLFVSDNDRVGVGKGRRDVARTIEWLRKKDIELGLITNGKQWRIVYAGETSDAWSESSSENWFAEGEVAPALQALRHLLNPISLGGPLKQAVLDTRRGQSELSAALGERVRQAVEHLIVACRKECDEVLNSGEASLADIYTAGVRMVMRIVVLMFAESRELLPLSERAYYQSYSIRHLVDLLKSEGSGYAGAQRLREEKSAFPRILSLCRLIHAGSPHARLPVPDYGGELFTPGNPSERGIERALAAIENPDSCPNNYDVQTILDLITRAPIKIRQGRGTATTQFPVDFSQIDTEYIGILYEGLLDYELRRASLEQPQVILNLGDQPILPLKRLEAMDEKSIKDLLAKMKVKKKTETEESDGGDEDEPEDEVEEEIEEAEEEEEVVADIPVQVEADLGDRASVHAAAIAWAKRAVVAAKSVNKKASDNEIEAAAQSLIAGVRAPGEYYLVRFGGTRKGSGTFYTVPALAAPTVRRTLEPLLWDAEGLPRKPNEILEVKVCDPACGSGSFPLAALRLINEALYESLIAHGWLKDEDGVIKPAFPPNPAPEWLRDALQEMPGINEPIGLIGHDERIKARLKRHVVERCLYGVDINRLAVELTRVALWVETMDRNLPFSFLDHKFKVGNALVGCWFDRLQDYPLLAWLRESGDLSHSTFVHHEPKTWTKAIAEAKKEVITEVADIVAGQRNLYTEAGNAEVVHEHGIATYRELSHNPTNPDRQREAYEGLRAETDFSRLKRALDAWCSVWFWHGEDLSTVVPAPRALANAVADQSQDAALIIDELARDHKFFHWELEFPDVFQGADPGFHAVVGNPPWEIQKPNSKEWFSNVDPLYRSYGKQPALAKQRELFGSDRGLERDWLLYNSNLKALSNWVRCAGAPFGDARAANSDDDKKAKTIPLSRSQIDNRSLHTTWESKRKQRTGHAPLPHPFVSQGSADINTYKLFLEQSLSIAKNQGRVGMIVPSGVYTDRGSVALRDRFLGQCRWEWLYGFENRNGIFNIHRSFKFCPVIVEKGGETEAIKTAFMRRELADWAEAHPKTLLVTREQVQRFSPRSRALLEVRDPRDVEILETMTANGVPLGEEGPAGWGVKYTREFDMTNDSKLFPPREKWEAQGYAPDEYGHWLQGGWKVATGNEDLSTPGLVFSRDRSRVIKVEDIEDVALPLYEGRMIGQFDFSQKGWVSGKGRSAVWRDVPWNAKVIEPQYLMGAISYTENNKSLKRTRISYMRIGSSTNSRTMTATVLNDVPSGDSVFHYEPRGATEQDIRSLVAQMNSYAYDYLMRFRVGGLNLSEFVVNESIALPRKNRLHSHFARLCRQLCQGSWWFSRDWYSQKDTIDQAPMRTWALTSTERMRLLCILDASIAFSFGLSQSQFEFILRDCDHPTDDSTAKAFTRSLDPKGFWRVDKSLDPEVRHTVLAQVAFADLQELIRAHGEERGLELFLGTGPDHGWMLPETLCLADYGLGHDDRAKKPQPVASRLGPQFFDWQLKQTPEESWVECRRHAANIRAIRSVGEDEIPESDSGTGSGTNLHFTPSSLRPKPKTGSLFEEPEAELPLGD